MRYTFVLLFCLLPLLAYGQQQNFGDSPYFISHDKWDCAKSQARFRGLPRTGLAFIWNTPGTNLRCLRSTLADPRVDFIEAVAVNETCVSRGDCGSYESLYGYNTASLIKAVLAGQPRVKKVYQEAATGVCKFVEEQTQARQIRKVINPSLETHLTRQAFSRVASWVAEVCPGWEIVWNPVGGSPGQPQPPATLSEGHGNNPRFVDSRCIANPDGTVIPNSRQSWEEFFRRYAKCAQVFHWGLNDNCNFVGGPRLDPRKRQCKVTEDYRAPKEAAFAILQAKVTPAPWTGEELNSLKGCKEIKKAQDGPKGFVWKESDTKLTASGKKAAVALFPASYGRFKELEVQHRGIRQGLMSFVYNYTEDGSSRAVWKSNLAPDDLPFNVVLRGKDSKGIHCWKIPDPHDRND